MTDKVENETTKIDINADLLLGNGEAREVRVLRVANVELRHSLEKLQAELERVKRYATGAIAKLQADKDREIDRLLATCQSLNVSYAEKCAEAIALQHQIDRLTGKVSS